MHYRSSIEDLSWQKQDSANLEVCWLPHLRNITQSEQQKEKRMNKKQQSLRGLWESSEHTNICIMEISERQEGAKRILVQLMAESFLKLMNTINLHVIEPQKTPSKIISKRPTWSLSKETLRHVTKLSKAKDEEGSLEAARGRDWSWTRGS